MKRELCVYLDKDLVGTLSENSGIWSLLYDENWVLSGFDLCPGLPRTKSEIVDGGSVRPVQWFFDNLLPEEAARAQLITTVAKTTSADAWTLLAQFGSESAGALTLLPPGVALPEAGLQPLPDADLEARIKAMPRQPLSAKAPKKMSLAGAQQKLPVVLVESGALFEPTGAQASTHILKPDVLTEHYPSSAVNEWFCARLAQKMGLPVPPVQLRYVPSSVYIIQRFDRSLTADGIERLHTLDSVQLLSLAAGAKYAKSGTGALVDIIDKCRVKAPTRLALFRWTLFNILVGNSDAHLKNISLFANREGYFIAPHYDLLSTAAWSRPELVGSGEPTWPHIEMSFPIEGAVRYDQLQKSHVMAFANRLGLPSSAASREFGRLIGSIEAAADQLVTEFEARKDVPPLRRAAELRMIRSIRHLPIASMVKALSM